AIREMAQSRPFTMLPGALKTLGDVATDPSHKDSVKAALAIVGMAGMGPIARQMTDHRHEHTHKLDPISSIEAKLAQLPPETAALLRKQLLPPDHQVIDVTPEPVED